ncbi:MAG: iron-containing alcohol dehydrogenase [Candidatus Poribacteria bacterium]|nr:iron-containing alcohol dehydrogenase [Candidatus Poribacteria bacterium]
MISEFSFPTRIVYGAGARTQLPELVKQWDAQRIFVVTDPGIVRVGLHERIAEVFAAAGVAESIKCEVFSDIQPNPVEENVRRGTARFREMNADLVIGFGGGSALDVAKAIRLHATHDLPLDDYDEYKEGWKKTHPNVPPMIGIPTTAGTGSEVGRSAVITLDVSKRKTVLFSPYLMPNIALLDPELTVGLPPHLTAATGMDALTHSIESYLSINFHPYCDAVALHGIRLCATWLPRSVEHGGDLDARGNMLLASAMGATAFQKGLGAIHSLAHPLSTQRGIHHGLANAILLPYVLQWNLEAASQKMAEIASALGCRVDGASPLEAGQRAVDAVVALCERVGIPKRLSEIGIEAGHLDSLTEEAFADGCRLTNPRPTTTDDLRHLYQTAL